MHPNEELIKNFYAAFNDLDGETMAASYQDDAHFRDPVFPDLDGPGVRAMWRMLTSTASGLRIEASYIEAGDESGSVHWEAWYEFSATGRSVHNVVEAKFEFRDGKIYRHVDDFDFWRWSRQALGAPGLLLGWTPMLHSKVQEQAGARLEKWRASHDA